MINFVCDVTDTDNVAKPATYIHTITDSQTGQDLYVAVQFEGEDHTRKVHPSRVRNIRRAN